MSFEIGESIESDSSNLITHLKTNSVQNAHKNVCFGHVGISKLKRIGNMAICPCFQCVSLEIPKCPPTAKQKRIYYIAAQDTENDFVCITLQNHRHMRMVLKRDALSAGPRRVLGRSSAGSGVFCSV